MIRTTRICRWSVSVDQKTPGHDPWYSLLVSCHYSRRMIKFLCCCWYVPSWWQDVTRQSLVDLSRPKDIFLLWFIFQYFVFPFVWMARPSLTDLSRPKAVASRVGNEVSRSLRGAPIPIHGPDNQRATYKKKFAHKCSWTKTNFCATNVLCVI